MLGRCSEHLRNFCDLKALVFQRKCIFLWSLRSMQLSCKPWEKIQQELWDTNQSFCLQVLIWPGDFASYKRVLSAQITLISGGKCKPISSYSISSHRPLSAWHWATLRVTVAIVRKSSPRWLNLHHQKMVLTTRITRAKSDVTQMCNIGELWHTNIVNNTL